MCSEGGATTTGPTTRRGSSIGCTSEMKRTSHQTRSRRKCPSEVKKTSSQRCGQRSRLMCSFLQPRIEKHVETEIEKTSKIRMLRFLCSRFWKTDGPSQAISTTSLGNLG